MNQLLESTALQLISSSDVQGAVEIPTELAANFDVSTLNDNLVRLYVRAFGWEVNRNNFLFNKASLLKEQYDALGKYIPAWQSFEKQLVNANHLMKDNSNSRVDRVIGFIEDAELKDDGVYLTLIAWKRTLTEDELIQLREGKVAVSMEVRYNNPLVIVDGKSYPPSAVAYDPRTAIRTMGDDSTLSFIGIAILFDNIKPGFGSQEVLVTENAAQEVGALVSEDTHQEVSMEKTELEKALADSLAKQTELAAQVEAKEAAHAAELAEMKEKLEAAQAEVAATVAAKKEEARAANFAAAVNLEGADAKVIEIANELFGKLDGENADAFAELAATIIALAAACAPKKVKADDEDAAFVPPCKDGTCGKCVNCLKAKEKADADAELAAQEASRLAAETAALELAALEEKNKTTVNLAGNGGEAPVYGHRHL